MTTKKETIVNEPTSINILNMARNAMSEYYRNIIPEATQDNLAQVFDKLMTYQASRNELMQMLPTLIGIQTMDAVNFKNPLAVYKKNPIRFGQTD